MKGSKTPIDVKKRKLHLHVSDEEIQERFQEWSYVPKKVKGYLATYAKLVKSADKGAILA